MSYKLTILSLGAGVQSSVLFLMGCKGMIHFDVAIFADTGWETQATYKHLVWLTEIGKVSGKEIIKVAAGDVRNGRFVPKYRGTYPLIPAYTTNDKGILRCLSRWCTYHHKLRPIEIAIRQLLGVKPKKSIPVGAAEKIMGFSLDEITRIDRMILSHMNKKVTPRFPLAELGMTRADCKKWLWDNYHLIVPKSACVGCPYRTNEDWLEVKTDVEDFNSAIEYDHLIRNAVPRSKNGCFLHPTRRPLEEVNFVIRERPSKWDSGLGLYKQSKHLLFLRNVEHMNK